MPPFCIFDNVMDKFFQDIALGITSYFKAIGFIFKHNLWPYFFVPVLINILLFVLGIYGVSYLTGYVQDYLLNLSELENAQFFGAIYLKSAMSGIVWVLLKIIFFLIFTYIGGYLTLIIMSPFLALLSEKTEEILTGRKYPFNVDQFVRDIVRGVVIALRNLLIETGYVIIALLLSFIPVINIAVQIILFIISSYFYGFSFMDYTNERRRLTVKQSVQFIRKNKGVAIANGAVFSFLLMVPYCGYSLAGFGAIISVVAATIAIHQKVDLSKTSNEKI
jgi:CysZ protein